MNWLIFLLVLIQAVIIVGIFKMVSTLNRVHNLLETITRISINHPNNRITIKCSSCGRDISVPLSRHGSVVSCPDCKSRITVNN